MSRKDIKHLFESENETARFGDWRLFGRLLSKPRKGYYQLNLRLIEDFFRGRLEIPTIAWVGGQHDAVQYENYATVLNIKGISEFLNADQQWVVLYLNQEQGELF